MYYGHDGEGMDVLCCNNDGVGFGGHGRGELAAHERDEHLEVLAVFPRVVRDGHNL